MPLGMFVSADRLIAAHRIPISFPFAPSRPQNRELVRILTKDPQPIRIPELAPFWGLS